MKLLPIMRFAPVIVPGILGAFFIAASPASSSPEDAAPLVRPSTGGELAVVSGLQEIGGVVIGPVLEEGKCCTAGNRCTPDSDPDVDGAVPCTSTGSQCENYEDGRPCWRWSSQAVRDGKCVTAPPGMQATAQCGMDPRSFRCRKFRIGTCTEEWIGTDCYCDLDGAEIWVKGQKRCAQGSTVCLQVSQQASPN